MVTSFDRVRSQTVHEGAWRVLGDWITTSDKLSISTLIRLWESVEESKLGRFSFRYRKCEIYWTYVTFHFIRETKLLRLNTKFENIH